MTDAELTKALEVEAERDLARDEIERLEAALTELVNYCEDHDWGTIPVGQTIERACDLVRLSQQTTPDSK